MNIFAFTGFLTADAARCVRSASKEVVLTFKFCVADGKGKECFLHGFVDDQLLVDGYEPFLTAGRAVILTGEVTTIPFVKHGVTLSQMESFRVFKAEFPNRGGKKVEAGDKEEPEDEEEAA